MRNTWWIITVLRKSPMPKKIMFKLCVYWCKTMNLCRSKSVSLAISKNPLNLTSICSCHPIYPCICRTQPLARHIWLINEAKLSWRNLGFSLLYYYLYVHFLMLNCVFFFFSKYTLPVQMKSFKDFRWWPATCPDLYFVFFFSLWEIDT